MKKYDEHDYVTYPRNFSAYSWYKPLLVALLTVVFLFIGMLLIEVSTKLIFRTAVSSSGYDDMDLYTSAGAFNNGAMAAIMIPCLLIAALIVKDRPISSYFSSMGGWRWIVFLKTLVAGIIIVFIPSIIWFALKGRTGDVRFTVGGFILLTLFVPFQGLAEELMYRSFIMQTAGSWFKLPIIGLLAQMLVFASVHPYNIVGVITIAISALIYGLACILSKGLESPTVLHIMNNMSEIYMAGFGFGLITAEQTVADSVFNLVLKVLFLLFVFYASKTLHWFDGVKRDDISDFNSRNSK